jgi:DNA-directed RNA polymerase sigma subunit (sigma70/sigma32)
MNLTRERIRQLELKALSKLEAIRDMRALRELIGDVDLPPLPRAR